MGEFTGKTTRTETLGARTDDVQQGPGKRTLVEQAYGSEPMAPVQRKGGNDSAPIRAAADAGASGPGGPLPHFDRIQQLFGRHDVSAVRAHTDQAAVAANVQMGSQAYARANDVAFGGPPDLYTAAHEAAHVVQQRGGVQLKGGVGEQGDAYERHADAVADTVVAGASAESLLSAMAGFAADGSKAAVQHAVQFIGTPLNKTPPASEPVPAFGEDKGEQRQFSPEQYIAMWEKEQGREMTPVEKETINRGCIGVTAANLNGGGDPLNVADKTYATFELAHQYVVAHNKLLDQAAKRGAHIAPARYVMFAKLFWSNQSANYDDRLKPDDKAFLPDPKTGEIDMKGYHYEPQSLLKYDAKTGAAIKKSYINFDYGFWDDASHCFWHANHMQYKDPQRAAKDPMKVLQSTREKFVKGYLDFDRIVFCVALANHYNPGLAAIAHAGSQ